MSHLQRILYVEDDADILAIGQLALEQVAGFEVCACESGARALAAAADFKPQIMLLDVMLPDMDGLAILAALRRIPETADTLAIFMTAKLHAEDRQVYCEAGVDNVIAKPFDPMTLGDEIRAIWDQVPH